MLQVIEIFSSIQGEGPLLGKEALFIRFAGCNNKCSWCDSKYTFNIHKAVAFTPAVLAEKIRFSSCPMVVFTGGEPLLQDHKELINICREIEDYKTIAIETNGTILPSKELLRSIDYWSVSPKLSSSGNAPFPQAKFDAWLDIGYIQFKFVIKNKQDMQEVGEFLTGKTDSVLSLCDWVIQPEASVAKEVYKNLPKWTKQFAPELVPYALYLPQIHKLMRVK